MTPLAPARGASEQVSSLALATLPSAAGWARRYTTAVLHAWQLLPETIQTAELLVSELVTNSLNALGCPSRPLTCSGPDGVERILVTLSLLPGRVVIEVSDTDPRPPVLGSLSPDAESGRGLVLIAALTKEWGFHYPPAGGKVTFAVLGIPTIGENA